MKKHQPNTTGKPVCWSNLLSKWVAPIFFMLFLSIPTLSANELSSEQICQDNWITNNGSCAADIYHWVTGGDIYLGTIHPGETLDVCLHHGEMVRATSSPTVWSNLAYDQHHTINADPHWYIVPEYCGPVCDPTATVVNNGPCPINVYEWLPAGDIFLTSIAAGGSTQINAYDGMMLRFVDEVNQWSNLLFDEHVTVGCNDQTFNVTPNNYCGNNPPPATGDLNCPADVTVGCGDSTAPANTGSASASNGNYNISHSDSEANDGCNKIITRTWTGVYAGPAQQAFTEGKIVKYDMEDCGSPYDSMSEFTADYYGVNGISASHLSNPSGSHSCVDGAVGNKAVCIDADDDCNGFSGDTSGHDPDADVVSFDVHVNSGDFKISKLSFYEVSPEWIPWANAHNNYPTKYGVRVLKNGQEIYISEGNTSTRHWSQEVFDFSNNAAFTVSGNTTFTFELLGYCKANIANNSYELWDLDHIKVWGGAISTIDTADISCTQTITAPRNITVSAAGGGTLTCDVASVNISASANIGAASLSWTGPNGFSANGAAADVSVAGTYTVTATCGANGCSASDTVVVLADDAAPAAAASNDGPLSCCGGDVTISATGGGSYSWSGPNGFSGTSASAVVDAAGTYTVTVTAANGCTDTASTTVEQAADVSAPALTGGPFEFCVGNGEGDFIPAGAIGSTAGSGANNAWVITDADLNILGLPASPSDVDFDGAGTGTCLVWLVSFDCIEGAEMGANAADLTGCFELSNPIEVLRSEDPSASASNDGPLTCDDDSVTITATGGGSYAWTGPNGFTGSTSSASVSEAGTYTVTVTTAAGCTDTASTTVESDDDAPTASASNAGPLTCDETEVEISATGGGTYSWTGPNGFVGGDVSSAMVSEPGTYTVTVTSANGCTDSASTTVEEDIDAPTATASNDGPLTCDDTSVELSATGGGTYAWSGPNGFAATGATADASAAGTYTVTVTSANGCTDTASTTVTSDEDAPSVTASNDGPITCDEGSVTISATGGGTYSWTGPNGFVGGNVSSAVVTDAGTYTVTVVADNGCEATATTEVLADDAAPSAQAVGGEITCDETDVTLDGSSDTAGVTYSWTGPAGFTSSQEDPTVSSAGTYTLVVTADNGCESAPVTVTISEDTDKPEPTAFPQGDIPCDDGDVQIMASSDVVGAEYAWTGPNGFTSSVQSPSVSEAGTYTLTVTDPSNGCSETITVVVEEEECGKIGDTVFMDNNGNGVQDPGEMGLAGITVTLIAPDGTQSTMLTDNNGKYDFTNLPAGDYTVVVGDGPDGKVLTTPGSDSVSLAPGEDYNDADFGFDEEIIPLGNIGDTVFFDDNNNGVQDPGEAGIPGVTVTLTNPDGTTSTMITNNNGYYDFTGLPAGDYTSTVGAGPAGYDITTFSADDISLAPGEDYNDADFGFYQEPELLGNIGDTVFFDDNNNGVQDAGEAGIPGVIVTLTYPDGSTSQLVTDNSGKYDFLNLPAGDYTSTVGQGPAGYDITTFSADDISLAPGEDYNDADFGFYQEPAPELGTIGDTVFMDNNGNGIQDAGEMALAGVTVTLTAPDGTQSTMVTDNNGNYDFTNLPAGQYTATVGAGPDGKELTTPGSFAVNLAPGEDYNDADFGFDEVEVLVGNIGDTVFFDDNNNGVQDPGEAGIPGVTVTLTAPDGTTSTLVTNNNGYYDFTGLPAGNYTSTVGAGPAGYNLTTFAADQIALAPGEDYNDADFGFYQEPAPLPGTIGDTVFMDNNGNGVQDPGEMGLSGIAVTLIAADGTQTTLLTNAGGTYDFTNLPAGTYMVQVGMGPDGKTLSTPGSFTVNLAPGEDYNAADFGFEEVIVPVGNIGDTVFFDDNNNGVQDPGEAGIPGVTVTLTNPDGTTSVMVTNNNGFYDFTGLPAGNYTSTVGAGPAGYNLTTFAADQISLAPGEDYNDADFGFYQEPAPLPGTIGDTVFMDNNGNGVQDPGEMGLSGIAVTLIAADGTQTTILTGAGGAYDFTNVPAGTYMVQVGMGPAGKTLSTPGSFTVNLAPGQDYNAADFGFEEVIVPVGNIGDTVFFDDNNNGVQDPGEAGIPGVVITLNGPNGPATLVTNNNGMYDFTGLPAGNYTATVGSGPAGYNITTPASFSISLAPGQDYNDADYGFYQEPAPVVGNIGDTVFWDYNSNGFQDPGEPGIPGITVQLIAANGTGSTLVTDANGMYDFIGLAPGVYMVSVQMGPAGTVITTPGSFTVNLAPNQDYNDADFGFDTPEVPGCTDPNACNYDASATVNNGTCTYGSAGCPDPCNAVLGCTNPTASNYNPSATCDNGSCNFPVPGCTDATACNYNPSATSNNGTCDYGNTACPANPCNAVVGCTDPAATNYNPAANCNNGCTYAVPGCTSPDACNYNPAATVNDGSCYFGVATCPNPCTAVVGCTNPAATNYNPAATCDNGSCVLPQPTGCISGTTFEDANQNGVLDAGEVGINNITMALYDSANNLTTYVTVNNGFYEFCGLVAGNYSVVAGLGPNGSVITTAPFQSVSLGAGMSASHIDFGYYVQVLVPCDGQTSCVEELTPTDICPQFCNIAGGYTITSAQSTFDCGIQIGATCISYTALPGMTGFDDHVTITATATNGSGQTETITYVVQVGNCGGVVTPPVTPPTPPAGCGDVSLCTPVFTALTICPDYCTLADNTYTINNVETIFDCSIQNISSDCIRYTPLPGFAGTEMIEMTACAGGNCETVTATVVVGDDCNGGGGQTGGGTGGGGTCSADQVVCTQPLSPIDVCLDFCDASMAINSLNSSVNANIVSLNSSCFRLIPLPGYSGIINVNVAAQNAQGATETAVATVSVTTDCSGVGTPVGGQIKSLKIPNAFSPNHDGVNDVFEVKGLETSENVSITIVDQNGAVVFIDKQFTGKWNGSFQGQSNEVDSGTYFYVLTDGVEVVKGFIEVKK